MRYHWTPIRMLILKTLTVSCVSEIVEDFMYSGDCGGAHIYYCQECKVV